MTSAALVQELYLRYGSVVHRRASVLLGSAAEADDAVQDVFMRVIHAFAEFRAESSPMTWLYRVTTNLCLNRLRNETRRRELRALVNEPSSCSCRRIEVTPELRDALGRIPESQAMAGIYYFVDGMTHQEIATLLDVSRRTVGNWVEAFARQLREELSEP